MIHVGAPFGDSDNVDEAFSRICSFLEENYGESLLEED